jgi:fructuronate reductase
VTPRLSLATLEQLPRDVAPLVDPGALRVGIVHLGVGAFHRAHQAAYTEAAIAAECGDWGICGVSQRSPDVVAQLGPQDGLYTLAQRDGAGERLRVIGAMREVHWAQADADVVRERIAAPATRLVTLTVTEKGYHHDPATNRLALDDPAVAADLADGGSRTVAWRDGARTTAVR